MIKEILFVGIISSCYLFASNDVKAATVQMSILCDSPIVMLNGLSENNFNKPIIIGKGKTLSGHTGDIIEFQNSKNEKRAVTFFDKETACVLYIYEKEEGL